MQTMTSRCLNCGLELSNGDEFCKYCQEDLDEMVDAKELESMSQVEMQNNVNPFFSSSQMTGNIRDEREQGTVSAQVAEDNDSASTYWAVILGIVALLILMIGFFIG